MALGFFIGLSNVACSPYTESEAPAPPEVRTALLEVLLKSKLHSKEGPCVLGFAKKILGRSVHKIEAVILAGQDLIFGEWSDIFIH